MGKRTYLGELNKRAAKGNRRQICRETQTQTEPADRLSQDAAAATAAGVSYGKFKEMERQAALRNGKASPAPDPAAPDPRLKYDLICAVCARPFKSKTSRRKYCCTACKGEAACARILAQHETTKEEK